MNILKVIFLFVGIFFSMINFAKAYEGDSIPFANFFYQAIGITGFIVMQWLI